jgi:carotenoid cleavage dioxygenase
MLHAVRLGDGKAGYLNRYIRTRGFERERQAGRALWGGFLEPSGEGIKNVANTALIQHAGRLLALWEGGEPHEIRAPALETVGPYHFGGRLTSPVTAHPKVDPVTGEMMFFGYSLIRPPYLRYSIVDSRGELKSTVALDLPVAVMMHDFAITERYTIFLDLPLTFRPERLESRESPLAFERERPGRFGILPRHGDNATVRWFESPSCYVFHTLNAYEMGDEVLLSACRSRGTDVLGASPGSAVRERDSPGSDTPALYGWRFNLRTGEVREGPLDDRPCEFPRINEGYLGRRHRYGYAAKAAPTDLPKFDGLLKFDLETREARTHSFGAGRYGGEGVFAPRPGAGDEDDGWLMTFVHDEGENTSELVIVNARSIEGEPIARIHLPRRVPYGFHGAWVPSM